MIYDQEWIFNYATYHTQIFYYQPRLSDIDCIVGCFWSSNVLKEPEYTVTMWIII